MLCDSYVYLDLEQVLVRDKECDFVDRLHQSDVVFQSIFIPSSRQKELAWFCPKVTQLTTHLVCFIRANNSKTKM